MLGASVRPADALLGLGHDAADRPSAQAAGAESEGFEKAVVEFFPSSGVHQFLHRQRRDRARRAVEQGGDVGFRGLKQAAIGDRGGEGFGDGAHFERDRRRNPGHGNPVDIRGF